MAREDAMEERGGNGRQAQTAYDNLLAKYQEAAADLNAKYAEYKTEDGCLRATNI
jgi:hypothetical protein